MDYFSVLNKFHKSFRLQDDCENAYSYISEELKNGSTCFEMGVLNKYRENPDFVELCIFCQMLSYVDSNEKIEYISRRFGDFQIRKQSDAIITEDEIFASSIMSFIYSIFAIMIFPDDSIVFENCFKNIIVALDLQGRHLKLGTYDAEKHLKTLKMPDNIKHIASDIYYSIWAFQVAHEIYHIICGEEKNSITQEIEADKYGYSILIKLIEEQKCSRIMENCRCFYEYTYLSPVILFEYYKLYDFWKELCGLKIKTDILHPSNEQRENMIFSLFEEVIPDDLNTEEGNAIIASFLDALDYIIENIKIKAKAGKLDSIIKCSEI